MTNRWLEPTRLSRPCANDRHDPSRGNYPKERSRSATPQSTLIPEALSHQRGPRARSGLSERLPAPHRTRLDEYRFGDLKLFEPKTMCPIIAVRDREGR
jgi:hypothetical protein